MSPTETKKPQKHHVLEAFDKLLQGGFKSLRLILHKIKT